MSPSEGPIGGVVLPGGPEGPVGADMRDLGRLLIAVTDAVPASGPADFLRCSGVVSHKCGWMADQEDGLCGPCRIWSEVERDRGAQAASRLLDNLQVTGNLVALAYLRRPQ